MGTEEDGAYHGGSLEGVVIRKEVEVEARK